MSKQQSFEKAFQRLETIAKELESGSISLEQSVGLYEEGMKLIRFCEDKLNDAEKKILKLSKNEAGEIEVTPLEESE